MNSRVATWTVEVEDIEIQSRVGIWEHERELQPLRISLSLRGIAPAVPQSIEDCLDYQPICAWITDIWPTMPHTALLETKVRELMDFIFDFDHRIEWVSVSIAKTKAFPNVRSVGIRMELTRQDHESMFSKQTSHATESYSHFHNQTAAGDRLPLKGVSA